MLSLAYSLATPLGEAPDEADHYAYAAYILHEGKLPVGPRNDAGQAPAALSRAGGARRARAVGGTGDRSFLRANPDMAFGPDSPGQQLLRAHDGRRLAVARRRADHARGAACFDRSLGSCLSWRPTCSGGPSGLAGRSLA